MPAAPKAKALEGPLSPFVDRHIDRIEDLVNRKDAEIRKRILEKYSPLVNELLAFVKRRSVLLYGGTAINELLPKRLRFYKEYEFPDLDVLCVDAEGLMNDAVVHFVRKGYKFIYTRPALHEGTWRFFVEGLSLMDATAVSKAVYARMTKDSTMTSLGIRAANPAYLRMSLHTLLSQPNDSYRWGKVFKRILAFYNQFPPKMKGCQRLVEAGSEPLSETEAVLLKVAEEWVRDKTTGVMYGIPVFDKMMGAAEGKAPWRVKGGPALEVLVDDVPGPIAKALKQELGGGNRVRVVETKIAASEEFLPQRASIMVDKAPLVTFVRTNLCLSYVELHGQRLASLQTITRMALLHQFVENLTAQQEAAYECMANMLVIKMLENMTGRAKALLQPFIIKCYGNQPGMATLYRDRVKRMAA